MAESRRRQRRFRRSDRPAGPLRLTLRDLEILRLVAEHRFLSSVHLSSWLGGSRQNVLRRLQRLYHHRYLDRPRVQLDYFHKGGSRPMVYGLASRGAGRLRRDLDVPFSRMEWTGGTQTVGRLFLDHTLMISEVMTALEVACRRRGDVRLVLLDGLNADKDPTVSNRPFRWQVTLPSRQRVGVVPDRVFALEYPGADGASTRANFFLEADRGTMPVKRPSLRQSSMMRKLLAYQATWAQNVHQTRFGWNRFRVLTVTSSAERAVHLSAAAATLPRGHGLFLFTNQESLLNAADPLADSWTGVAGRSSLVPGVEGGLRDNFSHI